MENEDFLQAMKDIEQEIKKYKKKSALNSSKRFSSSTPKTSKQDKDNTAFSDSASSFLTLKDKSVNTTMELDLNFQLEALTEKCIELEKKMYTI